MYWARSCYPINSISDLELLARIFAGIEGEIFINDNGDEIVKWTKNPFSKLLEKKDELEKNMPFNLMVRLCGPHTIVAVSPQLSKLNPMEFQHTRKNVLMMWADYIDELIQNEMGRCNDMACLWENPAEKLHTMEEFLMACRLSKHATHIFFGNGMSALVFNPTCCYLPSFSIEKNDGVSSCTFDKDDGFTSVFGNDAELEYMNNKFKLWKEYGYKGSIANYCVEYCHHIL